MRTLDHLVELGYRGIAWKLLRDTESSSGSLSEVEEFEIWARAQDGVPRHFTLTSVVTAYKPMRRRISDETPISEAEYEAAVHANGIRDTAPWIAERERRQARRRDLDIEIAGLTPRCPNCSKRMILRTNGRGIKFFACPGYPVSCVGASNAPLSVAERIDRLLEEKSKLG